MKKRTIFTTITELLQNIRKPEYLQLRQVYAVNKDLKYINLIRLIAELLRRGFNVCYFNIDNNTEILREDLIEVLKSDFDSPIGDFRMFDYWEDDLYGKSLFDLSSLTYQEEQRGLFDIDIVIIQNDYLRRAAKIELAKHDDYKINEAELIKKYAQMDDYCLIGI